jgi:hypothetical protein
VFTAGGDKMISGNLYLFVKTEEKYPFDKTIASWHKSILIFILMAMQRKRLHSTSQYLVATLSM